MKQFTDYNQSEKLQKLGFPEPQSFSVDECYEGHYDYSIGELISFLDRKKVRVDIGIGDLKPFCVSTNTGHISWGWELIDLLFDLCVKLKEGGVI